MECGCLRVEHSESQRHKSGITEDTEETRGHRRDDGRPGKCRQGKERSARGAEVAAQVLHRISAGVGLVGWPESCYSNQVAIGRRAAVKWSEQT